MRAWVLVGLLLALLLAVFALILATPFLSPPSGPVGAALRAVNAGGYSEGYGVFVHEPVTFSGYQFADWTGAPERILSVEPTNRPAHVLLRTGVMSSSSAPGGRMQATARTTSRRIRPSGPPSACPGASEEIRMTLYGPRCGHRTKEYRKLNPYTVLAFLPCLL